jgi:hypothetical protein
MYTQYSLVTSTQAQPTNALPKASDDIYCTTLQQHVLPKSKAPLRVAEEKAKAIAIINSIWLCVCVGGGRNCACASAQYLE